MILPLNFILNCMTKSKKILLEFSTSRNCFSKNTTTEAKKILEKVRINLLKHNSVYFFLNLRKKTSQISDSQRIGEKNAFSKFFYLHLCEGVTGVIGNFSFVIYKNSRAFLSKYDTLTVTETKNCWCRRFFCSISPFIKFPPFPFLQFNKVATNW